MADQNVVEQPFPAPSKSASSQINGVDTAVTCLNFADKILITISQNGRLAHWVHIPLYNPLPDHMPSSLTEDMDDIDAPSSELLPLSHLTATTVLGGTIPERETASQLLATQIGSAILTRDVNEKRLLVVGLGLKNANLRREEFAELVGLVLEVL